MGSRLAGVLLLLSVSVSCADKELPLAVDDRARIPRWPASTVADPFFSTWSWLGNRVTSPIATQIYNDTVPQLYRQVLKRFRDSTENLQIANWASRNPGKLFIVGDEQENHPDHVNEPAKYAQEYCVFIQAVRTGDATAKFGPTGFSHVLQDWYRDSLYRTYKNGPCSAIPIAEWTFHELGTGSSSLTLWKDSLQKQLDWIQSLDPFYRAPVNIGSWIVDNEGSIPNGDPAYVARLREAMTWLSSQPNVISTRYLTYETYDTHNKHFLVDTISGYLTPEGQTLANRARLWITDNVPAYKGKALIDSANIHGDLQLGRVYWQSEVWIGGIRYHHAIGMHAPSSGTGWADFRIPQGVESFHGVFGLARQDGSPCSGTGRGSIYIDNVLTWTDTVSGSTSSTAVETGPIIIPANSSTLRLEVDALGSNNCAHTTWGDPHFRVAAPTISVSGPTSISQVGSHTWNSSVSATIESYTVSWHVSLNGGTTWSSAGTGSAYTRTVAASEDYSAMIRATVTTSSGQTDVTTHNVSVNTMCWPDAC